MNTKRYKFQNNRNRSSFSPGAHCYFSFALNYRTCTEYMLFIRGSSICASDNLSVYMRNKKATIAFAHTHYGPICNTNIVWAYIITIAKSMCIRLFIHSKIAFDVQNVICSTMRNLRNISLYFLCFWVFILVLISPSRSSWACNGTTWHNAYQCNTHTKKIKIKHQTMKQCYLCKQTKISQKMHTVFRLGDNERYGSHWLRVCVLLCVYYAVVVIVVVCTFGCAE